MSQATSGWVPWDDFPTRLLLARKRAGLTVREAAVRTGLHYATWSTWERGASPAHKDLVVAKIAEELGCDRNWLMWGGPLASPPDPGTPLPAPNTDTGEVPNEVTAEYLRLRAA